MWTRAQLKENAKLALKGRYWMAFLASIVAGILIGGSSGGGGGAAGSNAASAVQNSGGSYNGFESVASEIAEAMAVVVPILLSVGLLVTLIVVGFSVFVSNPMKVGHSRYYMENRTVLPDFAKIFSGFNKSYMNVVTTMFMRDLFAWLWSLLFVIPGIIKGYAYWMVDYIMAENPGMDWHRAMDISKAVTNGEKWNMFVLDLSFLGWALLGVLCCGIGTLFLTPYINATKAELYEALREKALAQGLATTEELPGYDPAAVPAPVQ